ncbi:MAG: DUF4013 domain-containing protein [Euryarchaeota archaeon]|nr:DUF4013 domain-containing protein [Euryarchaeota archaeon]
MDIGNLVTDSLKYPLSDWPKILILGIIIVISQISSIVMLITYNTTLTSVLGIIGLIVGLFGYGYLIRIIKSSVAGVSELPEFDEWAGLLIDGIKVAIVGFIYSLPAIIIVLISAAALVVGLLGSISGNPSAALSAAAGAGVGGIILAMLYMIIIVPIVAMAVAHMAYNDQFGAAFRFSELFDKIGSIGWGDLIVWYIVVGILYLILAFIGGLITGLFSLIHPIVGLILMALIVSPYLQMFLARAVALEYMSE